MRGEKDKRRVLAWRMSGRSTTLISVLSKASLKHSTTMRQDSSRSPRSTISRLPDSRLEVRPIPSCVNSSCSLARQPPSLARILGSGYVVSLLYIRYHLIDTPSGWHATALEYKKKILTVCAQMFAIRPDIHPANWRMSNCTWTIYGQTSLL